MDRSFRESGRAGFGDYDDFRGYGRQGSGYHERDLPLRDSYLGSQGGNYGGGRSSLGAYEREFMESIMQQRALQQQLSFRESQLALASSLLQQQHQSQYINKRRMDSRSRDRQDFKRPRPQDIRSRPRDRYPGNRDSNAGGRGSRGSSYRRNQNSSHRRSSSEATKGSKESYDPEKPTAEEDAEKGEGKVQCKTCNVDCEDEEDLKKHMSSNQHKSRMVGALTSKDDDQKSDLKNKRSKRYCYVCDVALNMTFLHHSRQTFHRKRKVQVSRGCGWCNVTSFKNFSEVLEHRATAQHRKNQELYEKPDKDGQKKDQASKDGRSDGKAKQREPIKVELPPELTKFDPKVVVGQACVIAVSGWFCKLCNKFYNNESAAKETHCMTEPHFNNYKKFMYTKLKAKAEAERDAREKAEAEEEKKRKEAEEAEAKKEEDTSETAAEKTEEDGKEPAKEEEQEEMEVGEDDAVEEEEPEADAEEEGAGEEVLDEAEDEYVDEEEAAAAEENLFDQSQDDGEDKAGTENTEDQGAEEPMVTEEGMGDEGADANVTVEGEESEESVQGKATRAAVTSGRGRGRGAGSNRARRGRKAAK